MKSQVDWENWLRQRAPKYGFTGISETPRKDRPKTAKGQPPFPIGLRTSGNTTDIERPAAEGPSHVSGTQPGISTNCRFALSSSNFCTAVTVSTLWRRAITDVSHAATVWRISLRVDITKIWEWSTSQRQSVSSVASRTRSVSVGSIPVDTSYR